MSDTPWVNAEISSRLPDLRARGESADLEYVAAFPSNARELAKEIAALATCGGGLILLGVTDDGDLRGLPEAASPDGRDSLLRRLEGICHGMVKPSVTPLALFGSERDQIILAIEVPQGSEPIYYCNNVPYLRHLTESRPAEPHEVVELVRAWLSDHPDTDPVFEAIATAWINLTLFALDLRGWQLDDGLNEFMSYLKDTAESLRGAAATDQAVASRLDESLRRVALTLEQAMAVPRYIGAASQQQVAALVSQARADISDLYDPFASTIELSTAQRREINRICREHSRRIHDLMESSADAIGEDRFVNLLQRIAWEGYHVFAVLAARGLADHDGQLTPEAQAAADLFNLPAKYPFFTDRAMREQILRELHRSALSLRPETDFAAM